jgi:DNA-directed RNA polymerase specialized sigma24 family protein
MTAASPPWSDRTAAPQPALTPEEAIDLRDALADLPQREREIIRLHHVEERPLPELLRTVHHRHSTVRDAEARALALDEGQAGRPAAETAVSCPI